MSSPAVDAPPRTLPRTSILAAVVFAAAVLAFAPSLAGGFVYDDHLLVEDNVHVHSLGEWRHWITSDFWDVSAKMSQDEMRTIFWRPLVTASYAIDWRLGHGSPTLLHVMNLLIHGIGAVLAFRALRRWTGDTLAAFFAALVLAVHPTRAESVAWIAGRTDVYCFIAMLLCAEGVARRLEKKRGGIALEVAATLVAYATKEQAIVLPALVAIEVWVALGRPSLEGASLRSMIRGAAPQLAIAIAYLGVRARFMPFHVDASKLAKLPFGTRVELPLETMGRFFALTIAPRDLTVQEGLVRVVPRGATSEVVLDWPFAVVGVVICITLVAIAIGLRKRLPAASLAIALYLGTLLPTSNVMLTYMRTLLSDRYLYLPLLGVAWLLAIGLGAMLRSARWTAPAALAATTLTLVFGLVAFRRSLDFADEDRLWARELQLHPDSPDALQYAMNHAIARADLHEALLLAARAQLSCTRSFADRGCDIDYILDGADLLARLTPDANGSALEAIARFANELVHPTSTGAHLRAGAVTIDIDPTSRNRAERVHELRASIFRLRADIASRLGDDDAAIELSGEAIAACPLCRDATLSAALIHARAGRYDEASAIVATLARNHGAEASRSIQAVIDRASLYAKESSTSEGPIGLVLHAKELSTLEVWGRAYAVLAPYRAQIEQAPGFAIGFAELAWRAGDPAVARDVLRGVVPADRVEPMTIEWSNKMGWGSGTPAEG